MGGNAPLGLKDPMEEQGVLKSIPGHKDVLEMLSPLVQGLNRRKAWGILEMLSH